MNWPLIVVLVLAAVGTVGFCLMIAAFVLIARHGGWQKAIQQPIAETRWTLPRRLLAVGASLGMLFGIGIVLLGMIPGGIPWRNPPVGDNAPPAPTGVVNSRTDESRPRPTDASAVNEQPAPDFDPKLTLEWPGVPEESRKCIDAGLDYETTIYNATYSQSDPATVFGASVYLISEKDLRESDPQEMLAGHMTSDSDEELTRQKIEHGPNKNPGYDVTAKSGTGFLRRVTVMVGRRLYSVEVLSLNQERLNAEDVVKFFKSFAIKD